MKIIRARGCCEVGDGVINGVGIPLREEGMGQGEMGRAQSTISHGRSHRGTPKGGEGITPCVQAVGAAGLGLAPTF